MNEVNWNEVNWNEDNRYQFSHYDALHRLEVWYDTKEGTYIDRLPSQEAKQAEASYWEQRFPSKE